MTRPRWPRPASPQPETCGRWASLWSKLSRNARRPVKPFVRPIQNFRKRFPLHSTRSRGNVCVLIRSAAGPLPTSQRIFYPRLSCTVSLATDHGRCKPPSPSWFLEEYWRERSSCGREAKPRISHPHGQALRPVPQLHLFPLRILRQSNRRSPRRHHNRPLPLCPPTPLRSLLPTMPLLTHRPLSLLCGKAPFPAALRTKSYRLFPKNRETPSMAKFEFLYASPSTPLAAWSTPNSHRRARAAILQTSPWKLPADGSSLLRRREAKRCQVSGCYVTPSEETELT